MLDRLHGASAFVSHGVSVSSKTLQCQPKRLTCKVFAYTITIEIIEGEGKCTVNEAVEFPQTLMEAITYFADPDRALRFFVEMRWPDGITCPRCGHREVSFISTRRIWKCKGCRQ